MNAATFDMLVAGPIVACQFLLINGFFILSGNRCEGADRTCECHYWHSSERIVVTIIGSWATIVVTAVFLSFLGCLTPIYFYSFTAAVGASLLWSLRISKSINRESESCHGNNDKSSYSIAMVVCGLWLTSVVVAYGILRLPCDWDSLAYHLPLVNHWIQSGHLLSRECAFWYVPGNFELISFWIVAGYSGDFWIGLSNVPAILLLIVSTNRLLQILSVSKVYRSIAVVSIVATQLVHRQLVSQENDLAVASLFITSVLFGLRWLKFARRSDGIAVAVALGLLTGTKYYALGYAVISISCICGFAIWLRMTNELAKLLASATIAAICLAGFWYIRNWIWTGSPLYPKGFPSLGFPDQWHHLRPGNELSTLAAGSSLQRWKLLIEGWVFQSGPLSTLATVLAIAAACVAAVKRNWTMPHCYLALITAGTALVYAFTPNVIESVLGTENMLRSQYHPVRFGSCVLCISTVTFFTAVSSLEGHRIQRVAKVSAISILTIDVALVVLHQVGLSQTLRNFGVRVFWPNTYGADPWLISLVFVQLSLIWLTFAVMRRQMHTWHLFLAISILFIAPTTLLSSQWHRSYDEHFDRMLFSDALSKIRPMVHPSQRVTACFYRYYPLFGSTRKQKVFRPLFMKSETSFRSELSSRSATWIITRRRRRPWPEPYDSIRMLVKQNPAEFPVKVSQGGYSLLGIETETTNE